MKLRKMIDFGKQGIFIASIVTTLSLWMDPADHEIARMVTAWLVYGFCCGASSMIFYWESVNLLTATAIHYIAFLAVSALMNLYLGWAPDFWSALRNTFAAYTLIYAIIYLWITVSIRLQFKKINEKLNNR